MVRKVVLYGLLLLMLLALGYDYQFARPAVEEAYNKILEQNQIVNANKIEKFTDKDVAKLLGKEPAKSFQDGGDLVQEFHFTAGIPFRPHKLFAVYKKSEDDNLFYRHSKFLFEPAKQVLLHSDTKITGPEENREARITNGVGGGGVAAGGGGDGGRRGGAGGGGDRGGRGGGGDRGGRGRPDIEGDDSTTPGDQSQLFENADADKDGFVSGDEIPASVRPDMERIDTNGDQKISKDEFDAEMKTVQKRQANETDMKTPDAKTPDAKTPDAKEPGAAE